MVVNNRIRPIMYKKTDLGDTRYPSNLSPLEKDYKEDESACSSVVLLEFTDDGKVILSHAPSDSDFASNFIGFSDSVLKFAGFSDFNTSPCLPPSGTRASRTTV